MTREPSVNSPSQQAPKEPPSREAPMLETLSAIAMFVVLGVAAFTLGGVDQTA